MRVVDGLESLRAKGKVGLAVCVGSAGANSHASQGKSIDRGIVLMADDGIRAANLKQAYVSHSRFEESHMTYTTDRTAAMKAMSRPQDRELAIEMADERIRRWKIFEKLTQQAEAWAESRKQILATRQSQGSRITQEINA